MRYASRAENLKVSLNAVPAKERISLGGGYAFPEMLPDISKVAADVARNFRTTGLQYGPLLGIPELRDEIVRFIASDGVQAARENILILNGAKNGIDLVLRLFIDKGDSIIVTRPNYATALHISRNHEANFVEIGIDENGLDVDQLANTLAEMRDRADPMPKLLYIVPDFHNPAGVTLSLDRRKRLVELADTFDFVIIEDDPYRRINFGAPMLPAIQSFDTTGRVIGLGSFSKIFAPGIRMGWASASADIIGRMAAMKSDGGCSPFVQRIIYEMLRSGEIERHVAELSTELRIHRDVMASALQSYIPDATFTISEGGYYLWVKLPAGVDCDVVTASAEEAGVAIFSGRPYFAKSAPSDFIRLAYSAATPGEIDKGIRILGDVVRRLHNSGSAEQKPRGLVHQHFD